VAQKTTINDDAEHLNRARLQGNSKVNSKE